MKTATDLFQTSDIVSETGDYICKAGVSKKLQKGYPFPDCPETNEPTTWRHADHVHRSGDRVTEAGSYTDADGQTLELNPGDTFPNCPKSGQPTTWKHAKG